MKINQTDLEILERRFSDYILMAIYENPMSTKTDIMRLESGFEKTKFQRINELIAAGFIELVKSENFSTSRLMLTSKGKSVAEKLLEIRDIICIPSEPI